MSVSLLQAIEYAGYDIEELEDAQWLLSKRNEFVELIEQCEEVVEAEEERDLAESEAKYLKAFPKEADDE